MPTQKKKTKTVKHESITIRQAQHKNKAEEAHLNHVKKFLAQEQSRCGEDIERTIRRIRKNITRLIQTAPVPGQTLASFHEKQREYGREVAMHVVYCYLLKQERDKEMMARRDKDPNSASYQRPVTTPDHLDFIFEAFPEVLSSSRSLGGKASSLVDIYSHGRAGHDMKCMSTRARPVGGYPHRGPLNFRLWDSNLPYIPPHRHPDKTHDGPEPATPASTDKDARLPALAAVHAKIEGLRYYAKQKEMEKRPSQRNTQGINNPPQEESHLS